MQILGPIADSMRMAFFMFWDTLWPLIFGFGLSGAVQAFVSRSQMQRVMGDHRPRTLAIPSICGAASSSCSYAATAMAKSLFQKGADFTSAMVFMFASTNLVIELGVVLLVLLALVGSAVFTPRLVQGARQRLTRPSPGGHDHEATARVSDERQA